MKLSGNVGRIVRFLVAHRRDVLTRTFWKTVVRAARDRFNFWQRVGSERFQENLSIIESRPWNLHVELSNICNANCIFCAYQFQKREQRIMRPEIYAKVLDDYCAMGGGDLMLEVCVGDPATDPDFIERIRLARSRKEIARIVTITNAVALKRDQIEPLLRSGLTSLQISTAPLDADVYERIYRSKAYGRVKRNIKLLLETNQALGCPVEIKIAFRSHLGMRASLMFPDYRDIAHLPHVVEFNADFDSWSGQISQQDLLPGMRLRPQSKLEKEPCYWLYDGPLVYTDGAVGLCGCRDFNADSELIVGNVADDSLLSIWRSPRVAEIRQGFRDGDFPEICRKCTTYCNLDLYRTTPGTERAKLTRARLAVEKPTTEGHGAR